MAKIAAIWIANADFWLVQHRVALVLVFLNACYQSRIHKFDDEDKIKVVKR